MPANKLEKIIISSSKKAAHTYSEMTGGYWLSHAPEHFWQNEVARAIWKDDNYVFVDASVTKVLADMGVRSPSPGRQRFDISVFDKPGKKVRAVIELKTGGASGVFKDAKKIEKDFDNEYHATTGYLLVYRQASGRNRRENLKSRFVTTVPEKLDRKKWRCVTWFIGGDQRDEVDKKDWAWGVALYRFS